MNNSTIHIRVRITDPNCAAQLRKNFEEWAQSPASLLFFNSLKELTIEGQTIKRQPLGKGPVAGSSWVKLVGGANAERLLVIESEAIPFPAEAAVEIRAERGIGTEDLHLPPCRVEIVLGLSEENRLYVVLPTGAGLDMPFSCNAPFIQDPARFAIKDPATSPANRWLLQRAGRLVGTVMLECPASWPQLHALWSFVQDEINYDYSNERRRRMKIVPVDGSMVLHASNGVVRLSSRRDLLSPQDWKTDPPLTSPREYTEQIRLWSDKTRSFEAFQPDQSDAAI